MGDKIQISFKKSKGDQELLKRLREEGDYSGTVKAILKAYYGSTAMVMPSVAATMQPREEKMSPPRMSELESILK